MLKVGMVDVDLLNKGTRHPNLAQMKMSSYCKSRSIYTELIYNPEQLYDLSRYNLLLISKVFNFTIIPEQISKLIKRQIIEDGPEKIISDDLMEEYAVLNTSVVEEVERLMKNPKQSTRVSIGGTGFFEDGGNDLDDSVEHIMPDYHLYDDYIKHTLEFKRSESYFADYLKYSIGFTTRGCFRKCSFCVNKKYDKAEVHSPIKEFLDESRPYIYLWDDNFLACSTGWREILQELNETGKPFQFRQGLDLRIMSEEKAEALANSRYRGDFIFAFDHIRDKELIVEKLNVWRKYCKKETKLYVLCAYDPYTNDPKCRIGSDEDSQNEKDLIDIRGLFERIKILIENNCLPYVMRYESYRESEYKGVYTQITRWCNQPNIFKKMSFREFCERNQMYVKTIVCASMRAYNLIVKDAPDLLNDGYFDMKYTDYFKERD